LPQVGLWKAVAKLIPPKALTKLESSKKKIEKIAMKFLVDNKIMRADSLINAIIETIQMKRHVCDLHSPLS
jgi:hypothetical protein